MVKVVVADIVGTSVADSVELGVGPSSNRTSDKLGWHGPEGGSWGTESMERYNSNGRWVTHPFWLVWLEPVEKSLLGLGEGPTET